MKFFINEKFLLFSWHLSPRDTRSEFQNTAVLSQLASKAIILYLFLQVNYIWVPKYPKSFWVFWCSFQWLNQGKTNPCNTCCSTESLKVAQKSFQQLDFDGSLQPPFFTWCYNHGIKKLANHWWTCCHHFHDTICYLYIGLRATLNFQNFKVALNAVYRIFLNFPKSCIISCLLKFDNTKNFTVQFWFISP